jgi:hypothetical protein
MKVRRPASGYPPLESIRSIKLSMVGIPTTNRTHYNRCEVNAKPQGE